MKVLRWPLAGALALVLTGAAAPSARAVEPDAPDRLISRMEATLITVQNELSGKTSKKLSLGRADLKAFAEFYRDAGSLIWIGESGLAPDRAEALRLVFTRANEFGLKSSDYAIVDQGEFARESGYPAEWLADAELRMSAAAFQYAVEAQTGRVAPTSIDKEFLDLKPARPDAKALLKGIADAPDSMASFLEGFHPPHEQFRLLKDKLAEVRADLKSGAKPVRIPDGPALGPNTYHPHVAVLRARFSVPPSADAPNGNANEYYDEVLVEAVRTFQSERGLKPDGVIGRNTREALNEGTVAVSEQVLVANMERWRWKARNMGERYVWINVPEFMFRVMRGDEVIHEDRIVAGSPKHKTPIFSEEMETIVFNPYWNLPKSIVVSEIIPAARNNPGYLYRNNMEVIWLGRRTVDPYMIDWHQVDPNKLTLRQVPGPSNALGQVKFLFPNKHAVYMHDTPTKHLFNRPVRAYSHGCMRVRNPLEFARIMLSEQGWSEARIKKTLASAHDQHVKLEKKVPVHIGYFTAWVDKDGKLQSFRDIYGHDSSVRVALKLDSNKLVASTAEEFEVGEQGLRN